MKALAIGSPTARRLSVGIRLLLAYTTSLLLTLTILEREDRDGYQATHLFFMPRDTWEMDEGRGMLHEESFYEEIDRESLLGDGGLESPERGPRVAAAPFGTAGAAGMIHVAYGLSTALPRVQAAFIGELLSTSFTQWQADTPTPPPRALLPS